MQQREWVRCGLLESAEGEVELIQRQGSAPRLQDFGQTTFHSTSASMLITLSESSLSVISVQGRTLFATGARWLPSAVLLVLNNNDRVANCLSLILRKRLELL